MYDTIHSVVRQEIGPQKPTQLPQEPVPPDTAYRSPAAAHDMNRGHSDLSENTDPAGRFILQQNAYPNLTKEEQSLPVHDIQGEPAVVPVDRLHGIREGERGYGLECITFIQSKVR